ncbi:MAG TPA: type IV toxin-antitoxin system AbiEi family antitoxin domain-containing protein [Solirubrobacteraceae bacterium]|nr:type IV toxin-antitoxin system AbiEi family antitoxin domain-containing protein [Solirubrobacteraceae bacterium]
MGAAIERELVRLAERQRGYVTRPQLLSLGLTDRAIRHRLGTGRLIRAYAGVYAVGHLPKLPQDRAFGALLACGPAAVLSHGTAAVVWGIWKRWATPFEVTAVGCHRREGVRVHRAKLERGDVTTHIGLRVTTAARTVFDIAPRLTDTALRRAVADLRRPGYLHLHELVGLIERLPRKPGALRLGALVDVPAGAPTRSELEDRFLRFAKRFGLPPLETNVWVAGREVDIWFPRERVIVELDGRAFHSDSESYEGDRDNDATALAAGIPTVRITSGRLKAAPEREAERLVRILRSRWT